MLKLKDGSVVPSIFSGMSLGMKASNPNSHTANSNQQTGVKNYLQSLKNAQLQKKSQNLTLDKIKQTFQHTELEGDAQKKTVVSKQDDPEQ